MPGLSLRGNEIRTARTTLIGTLTDAVFQVKTTFSACNQADAIPLCSRPLEGPGAGAWAWACGWLSHQPEPPSQPTPALLARAEQLLAADARFEEQFHFFRFCICICISILSFTTTFIIDTISKLPDLHCCPAFLSTAAVLSSTFLGSIGLSNHTSTHRSHYRQHIHPPSKPLNISATCASSVPVIAVQAIIPPGRFDGPWNFSVVPTASHADSPAANLSPTALNAQTTNPRFYVPSPSQQPNYPGASPSTLGTGAPPAPQPAVTTGGIRHPQPQPQPQPRPRRDPIGGGARRNLLATRRHDQPLPPPFRNRAVPESKSSSGPPRRVGSVGRLWNPTNSTPRPLPPSSLPPSRPDRHRRRRRPSSPPLPPVHLEHPALDLASDPADPTRTGAGDYPLLSLPEQRQTRHSASTNTSVQIEGRASEERRISLPKTVRHSYDRDLYPPTYRTPGVAEAGPSSAKPSIQDGDNYRSDDRGTRNNSLTKRARAVSFGLVQPDESLDKGKAKAVMSPIDDKDPSRGFSGDLERGPDVLGHHRNGSRVSLPDGIGSPASSSDSSIMGDPDQPDVRDEWGPQHPCFPHLNPHVPLNSPEYTNTRIIRIRRDWLLEGDMAPTFSNLYPEILDPAGVSEQRFRRIIEKLNGELVPIFDPYNWRNILDGILGLVTGWLWDDLGFTNAKSKLKNLESWIENWNAEMEKALGSEEGTMAPKIISLRRTGYMSLDIQIPDPEIAPAGSTPGASRAGRPDTPSKQEYSTLESSPPVQQS